ncbi:MAG: hypothetical protein SFV21_18180, partial [Rhodospirillaceae bacterium]|nr:hypothetical protein [Rhodospirillaceae bacterium]
PPAGIERIAASGPSAPRFVPAPHELNLSTSWDVTRRHSNLPVYYPVPSGEFRVIDDYGIDSFESARRGGANTAANAPRPHRARDVRAEPGTGVVPLVNGVVTRIGKTYNVDPDETDPQSVAKRGLQYVEITGDDGYAYRTHYVAPRVRIGERVVGGTTPLGTVQDLSVAYPKDAAHPNGMINHVHVEIANPRIRAYDRPRPESSEYTTYLRYDPTDLFQMPPQWRKK